MDTQVGPLSDLGGMDRELGLDALRESTEFRGPVEPLDEHDHANGHFALIYETVEERLAATVPFVRQGLERGEQCLYVLEEPSEKEAVVEAFRESGLDVDDALESGDLAFYTVEETYLRSKPFDPDEILSFYGDVIDDVLEEYEGCRVVAGTDWIDDVPHETFMEYEGRVNSLFDEHDAMALCHYDRTKHSSDVIRNVVRTHPHLIYDDEVCHNFYYTPPDELLGSDDADEIDRMLQTLQDRAEAKTELARHERYLRTLTEVTADPNLSFEEKLQALLDLGCAWFDLDLGALNCVDVDADLLQVEHVNTEHEQFQPGTEIPLSQTFCSAAADIEEAAAISDPPGQGYDDLPVYEEFGIQSYLGTYIPIEGGSDRTLAFISDRERAEPFSEEDRTYLELMGQWVQYELERKRREERLGRSKQQFQRIFENSQDAIFINDPYADELLEVNPAGCELLGATEDEILVQGPSDFHPDEMDRFRSFVDEVYEEGSGWTDELTCLHSGGYTIPVEMSASCIEYDGRKCMLAIVRDISDRKERERNLERAERQFEATFNNPVSFMGLLDPDGTVRRINEHAREFVDVDQEAVAGEKFWETPWFTHSDTVQENVRDAVARAAAGEYVQAELRHQSPDGETLIIDAMLEPVRNDDGDVVTILASGRDITERVRHQEQLREAYEIIADSDRTFREQVDALLELGRETLGTDFATLSRVCEDAGEYIFEQVAVPEKADLQAGDEVPLEATNCERVVSDQENLVLEDVDQDAPGLAERAGNADWGISCYLGTPVTVDDEVYGTFCFYDMDARCEEFSDWEVTFVDLLGNWVGSEFERQRDTDRLSALNNINATARDINRALSDQSTRAEIERVVCERLAESDSYEAAWVGTADEQTGEIVPTTTVNATREFDDAAGDARQVEPPANRALRTGETQVVHNVDELADLGRLQTEDCERPSALAAIPIVHEDHSYGVLTVYTAREGAFDEQEREVLSQLGEIMGLTVAAIEREEALEHERERLELINRLLRHNLLNGLNLVSARLDMMEGRIDYEVAEHLDTSRGRIDEMIDLIQTLRALTEGLVDDDYELERVDIGRVLRGEVDGASDAYADAEFEVESDLDSLPAVLADDLLEEVFENLLVNAVRHNDKGVPRVTVDADIDAESVTVHVADNGPGVPEQMRETIFEKGEKGFQSPGTGFGLHLVREIIDVYDGDISISDNDPEGVVFSISVPRAT